MEEILIEEKTFEKARNAIQKNKGKKVIFSGENDELDRKVLENEKINVLLLKVSGKKDRMKQRDSGFNQVLAELAKKKSVAIGIYLDEIIESKDKKEILARVKQNIKLASKKKLKMEFFSQKYKREKHELRALGLTLGMPTWMTKNL